MNRSRQTPLPPWAVALFQRHILIIIKAVVSNGLSVASLVVGLTVGLVGAFNLTACSQSPPDLLAANLRLVYRPSAEGTVERLSYFALVSDADGISDLDELYLINDQAQLFWSIGSSEWLRVEQPGQFWIGSHSLAMPPGEAFPRGLYRAVLIDKSGERSERSVVFDVEAMTIKALPALTIQDGRYTVLSDFPTNSIVYYDGARRILSVRPLTEKKGLIVDLNRPAGARYIALWAEDGSQIAALTEAVNLP